MSTTSRSNDFRPPRSRLVGVHDFPLRSNDNFHPLAAGWWVSTTSRSAATTSALLAAGWWVSTTSRLRRIPAAPIARPARPPIPGIAPPLFAGIGRIAPFGVSKATGSSGHDRCTGRDARELDGQLGGDSLKVAGGIDFHDVQGDHASVFCESSQHTADGVGVEPIFYREVYPCGAYTGSSTSMSKESANGAPSGAT